MSRANLHRQEQRLIAPRSSPLHELDLDAAGPRANA
jgi:hypothetical protein